MTTAGKVQPSRWAYRSPELLSPFQDKLAQTWGLPEVVMMDNGPEFTSTAMVKWVERSEVKLRYIDHWQARTECLH